MLYEDVEEVKREIKRVLSKIDYIRRRDMHAEDGHEKTALKRAAIGLRIALSLL